MATPLVPPPAPAPTPWTAPGQPGGMKRPTGVTILAILGFIGAAFLLLAGLAGGAILGTLGAGILGPLGALGGAFFLGVFVVMAVIVAAMSWGFWKGMTWAWWVGVILYALSAVSALVSIVRRDFSAIVSLAINLFLIWYLTQKGVQRWFKVDMSFPWAK